MGNDKKKKKAKAVPQTRYLKLGDAASIFHDPGADLTVRNNQVLRFDTSHAFAQNSATIKQAITSGHLVETDEDEFDEADEQVTYNGRGVSEDVVTGGKKVPKEPGKEAKKLEALEAKQAGSDEEEEDDETDEDTEEDDENEEDEEEEDEEEDGDGIPDDIQKLIDKRDVKKQTLSAPEKKKLEAWEAKTKK